jgi:hypothetical protein
MISELDNKLSCALIHYIDQIKALQKGIKRKNRLIARLQSATPWIPISSGRLPDDGRRYQLCLQHEHNGRKLINYAYGLYVGKGEILAHDAWEDWDEDYLGHLADLDEQGEYWIKPGWYEDSNNLSSTYGMVRISEQEVIAYMPIEPYKPEEQ